MKSTEKVPPLTFSIPLSLILKCAFFPNVSMSFISTKIIIYLLFAMLPQEERRGREKNYNNFAVTITKWDGRKVRDKTICVRFFSSRDEHKKKLRAAFENFFPTSHNGNVVIVLLCAGCKLKSLLFFVLTNELFHYLERERKWGKNNCL